jgi:hypothetical protein
MMTKQLRNVKTAFTAANTLTAQELPAIRTLIATQNQFGRAAAPFSAESVLAAMAQLDSLSDSYSNFVNGEFKGWTEQLYDLLQQVSTVYDEKFPTLYLAYKVAVFPFNPPVEDVPLLDSHDWVVEDVPWAKSEFAVAGGPDMTVWVTAIQIENGPLLQVSDRGVFPAFLRPSRFNYHQQVKDGGTYDSLGSTRWPGGLPAVPPGWNNALTALLAAWDMNAPKTVFKANTFDTYRDVLRGVLDPASWTDVENVKSGVSGLWTSQKESMNALLAAERLTADDYFFLLHVLLGLVSGEGDLQLFTSNILTAPADPPGYPNDVFVNQLLYLALMYLADPLGSYGWNNAQLQQFVADVTSVVTGTDEASVAIAGAMAQQGKVLNSASSYPMIDPYNPSVGFTQRVTETVSALDKARASIRGKQ